MRNATSGHARTGPGSLFRIMLSALACVCGLAARARGDAQADSDEQGLFEFAMPWNDGSQSFTNLSFLLNTPAGKFGFVHACNGHLCVGNQQIRFVGMNFSYSANLP